MRKTMLAFILYRYFGQDSSFDVVFQLCHVFSANKSLKSRGFCWLLAVSQRLQMVPAQARVRVQSMAGVVLGLL